MNTSVRNKLCEHLEDPWPSLNMDLRTSSTQWGAKPGFASNWRGVAIALMNRGRRGEYWLMYARPATLDVLEGFLERMISGNARGAIE
jgi:hypothetical protein